MNSGSPDTSRVTGQIFNLEGKRAFVAGHRGMVGSAIVRALEHKGCEKILTASRDQLNLLRQSDVEEWMQANKPDVVFLSAAKVGGIHANNTYPAEFLYENLMIEANLIHAAHQFGVEKLVFLGSTCIYPKMAPQPIEEASLLTGPLEPTNEWYAIAKIAGIKLCQAYRKQYGSDFIALQPTNLYGPGDNYDLANSHVLPALLKKAHLAKVSDNDEFVVWGSGTPLREFLHVNDLAAAIIFLTENYSDIEHVNVGSGEEVSIGDLAKLICQVVGYDGKLSFDASKPDGTPRKLSDVSKLHNLGWRHQIDLNSGIRSVYEMVKSDFDNEA